MIDPAAIGTLLIGLNEEQTTAQTDRRRRSTPTARRRRAGIRIAVARGLRRAAASIEHPTTGELAS